MFSPPCLPCFLALFTEQTLLVAFLNQLTSPLYGEAHGHAPSTHVPREKFLPSPGDECGLDQNFFSNFLFSPYWLRPQIFNILSKRVMGKLDFCKGCFVFVNFELPELW